MLIYPAIDLKDGVCVRLMHGKFDQVTQYDEQPAARLSAFAAEGAELKEMALDRLAQVRPPAHLDDD